MSVDAAIFVNVSVKCWQRMEDEPFKPTRNWTTDFHVACSASTYTSDVGVLSTNIYNYCNSLSLSVSKTVLLQATVENATAEISGKGVVPMAKQHIDFALSGDEVTSGSAVANAINAQIANLLTRAKYI